MGGSQVKKRGKGGLIARFRVGGGFALHAVL
jgi:hypothetical protein